MTTELSDIFSLLTQPPGNWIYHTILSMAMVITAVLAYSKNIRTSKSQTTRHLLSGSLILLVLQAVFISISLLNSTDIFTSSQTHAFIERLIAALSVIWVIWMVYDQDEHILLHRISIVLSIAFILLALAFILLVNLQPQSQILQGQIPDLIWQSCILLTLVFGAIFIVKKRPQLWFLGIFMMLLLVLGHLLQLLDADGNTHAMGAVRLSQLISFCWLPIFAQRCAHEKTESQKTIISQEKQRQEKRVDLKPLLMTQSLTISQQETPEEKHKSVVKAVSLGLVADICYLARILPEKTDVQFFAGYDLIREVFLEATSLDGKALPNILDAWSAGRSFLANQTQLDPQEAKTLIDLLNYPRTGNLFAYPLYLADQTLAGGVIFLSPYTDKRWDEQSIAFMDAIREPLADVLFGKDPQTALKVEMKDARERIESLTSEKNILSQILAEKELYIKKQETIIKQLQAKNQIEKIEIDRTQEKMRGRIEALTLQLASMQSGDKLEQMKARIRQLEDEREQLKILLSRSEARIQDLETQTGQTGPIRLSMESQIISLDSIAANLRLYMRSHLQQENLNLEIINPDGRQMIKTDPELVQNILIGLVDNAIQASQSGAAIQLSQKLSFETGMLIIEVTDFGEGLSPEEQRLFFNAEKELIPGIGSIRAIRDAIRAIRVLNGKIWLRSKKGNFTTFRVQLPVRIID